MTLKRAATFAALLLALGACDSGSEPQNVTKIKVAEDNAYLQRLRGLSPLYRNLALRRAIQDSGHSCRRIEGSAEQEHYKNMSMWTARCEGGRDWAVFIAPNADVQVRSCDQMEQLSLPVCRLDYLSAPTTSS